VLGLMFPKNDEVLLEVLVFLQKMDLGVTVEKQY
jgi:hypothetical protein